MKYGADRVTVIAGFFTGGALAVRGGMRAARNSAIGCACLLAVIEGVGIGIQRMMAENTRLDVRLLSPSCSWLIGANTDLISHSYQHLPHHNPQRQGVQKEL